MKADDLKESEVGLKIVTGRTARLRKRNGKIWKDGRKMQTEEREKGRKIK